MKDLEATPSCILGNSRPRDENHQECAKTASAKKECAKVRITILDKEVSCESIGVHEDTKDQTNGRKEERNREAEKEEGEKKGYNDEREENSKK